MEAYPDTLPSPDVSYSMGNTSAVSRTPQETGRVIQRVITTGFTETYNVTFKMTQEQYDIFDSWFVNNLGNGEDFFSIDLASGGGVQTLQARFIGAEYNAQYSGHFDWNITGTLEVQEISEVYTYLRFNDDKFLLFNDDKFLQFPLTTFN